MTNRVAEFRSAAMTLALMVSPTLVAGDSVSEVKLPPFIVPLPADAAPPPTDPRDLRGMWLNYSRTADRILTAEGQAPSFTPPQRLRARPRCRQHWLADLWPTAPSCVARRDSSGC
jgi:hypothetical protein